MQEVSQLMDAGSQYRFASQQYKRGLFLARGPTVKSGVLPRIIEEEIFVFWLTLILRQDAANPAERGGVSIRGHGQQ